MSSSFFILDYLIWHYSRAFRDIVSLWYNVVWFITHFFSIPLLLRTLFSPWKRMTTTREQFGIEDMAQTFVFNLMSRVVGFFVRGVLLLMGFAALLTLILGLVVFLIVWLLLPFIGVLSLLWGTVLILT